MILVKGRSVYGYRSNCSPFIKILFLRPHYVKQVASILTMSTIMNHKFSVFEAHIPWELQFLMDHNLYGMGAVRIKNYSERRGNVNQLLKWSKADIEIDIKAENILNRFELLRFRNSRGDASGSFIRSHFMPSVVDMLESMNLDSSTQSQEDEKPKSYHITSAEGSEFDTIGVESKETQSCIEFCKLLPEACDYDLCIDKKLQALVDKSFDWHSSPIGGGHFHSAPSINECESSGTLTKSPSKINANIDLPFKELFGRDADSESDYEDANMYSSSLYSTDIVSQSHPTQTVHVLDYKQCELSSQIINSPVYKLGRQKLAKKYRYAISPPDFRKVTSPSSIPSCIYQVPFYTDSTSMSVTSMAGQKIIIPIVNIDALTPFNNNERKAQELSSTRILRPLHDPPLSRNLKYVEEKILPMDTNYALHLSDKENVCLFSVEMMADCKGKLLPNPSSDAVTGIVYTVYTRRLGMVHGVILCTEPGNNFDLPFKCVDMTIVSDEEAMFLALIAAINDQYDADILLGYDIQRSSFGFLEERAKCAYGIDLSLKLSRHRSTNRSTKMITKNISESNPLETWLERKTSTFQVFGRISLNVWRIMRSELDLLDYSFENVHRNVFQRHQPKYMPYQLMRMPLADVLNYTLHRSMGNISLLIETQVFTRTCEFARLFGVDFYSVLSRGSQFKVESLMLRLGHLESFLFLSPGKQDVVNMKAPECLQLIMEPEGRYYVDPLVVLDYQSLYPSVMIAYNYCFSTCLGRSKESFPRHLGVQMYTSDEIGISIDSDQTISTVNRVSFVKKNIREGLLSKMLSELLDARIKIKAKMATAADVIERNVYDARQLGIKYILNVTYGYTAASFSGRMPCVDIADSIVATGRATLENAVRFIESYTEWQARVVYGDTDSLFVLLPNRTIDEAFKIGKDMASRLSEIVPTPMALKFEKVYQPACLMAKKRYCARRWDSPSVVGQYEGKGVETVRRDGCPLIRRLFKETANLLFVDPNLTNIKHFVQSECIKIINGYYEEEDLSSFIFSREVRFGTYSSDRCSDEVGELIQHKKTSSSLPPSAIVAQWRMRRDPRDVAEYGERIPFIVVYQNPNSRLIDCVKVPESLLDESLSVNHVYYITKHFLPSIQRFLLLVGVDVNSWWQSLPRISVISYRLPQVMESYIQRRTCIVCHHQGDQHFGINICRYCLANVDASIDVLMRSMDFITDIRSGILNDGKELCRCVNHMEKDTMCMSLSCPVFWRATVFTRKYHKELETVSKAVNTLCNKSFP